MEDYFLIMVTIEAFGGMAQDYLAQTIYAPVTFKLAPMGLEWGTQSAQ